MAHKDEMIAADIVGYLQAHERKSLLRFITCGSVDDGKSTLLGRLLFDSKLIFEDQLSAVRSESKKFGTQGDDVRRHVQLRLIRQGQIGCGASR